jgi:type VI secretion system protein VasD
MMSVSHSLKCWTWLFLGTLALSGCQTVGGWFHDPTVVKTTFKVSPNVNRDKNGNPRAIWINYYLLESTGVFESAEFFDLKEHDQDLLTKDLLTSKRLWFNPGDEMVDEFSVAYDKSPEDTLYVAVMAGYRDLGNARWRATVELPSRDTSSLVVYLDELAVRLELED